MDLKKSLSALGLSNYEIEAYVYLVRKGPSEVSKIYKEANIPFGRVYDVLNLLATKGFVEIQNSRPKLYMITPPKVALSKFLDNKNQEMENELKKTRELVNELTVEISKTSSKKPLEKIFWIIFFCTRFIILFYELDFNS